MSSATVESVVDMLYTPCIHNYLVGSQWCYVLTLFQMYDAFLVESAFLFFLLSAV